VLDYTASSDEMGKNIGDDLAEGKPTLPLIHAMRVGTDPQVALIRKAIENGGLDDIDQVMAAVTDTKAIDYTADAARAEARLAIEALAVLPDSAYKQALQYLAEFSIDRKH
jgi:octaprenyl-diphosphate synthase